jgi:hypothetical protein
MHEEQRGDEAAGAGADATVPERRRLLDHARISARAMPVFRAVAHLVEGASGSPLDLNGNTFAVDMKRDGLAPRPRYSCAIARR